MSVIEKNISNFIETQFPDIYREEGPLFVEFTKKYYEWLEESNNALYHSRNLLDYRDVDNTVDAFVVKFKEKYLKEIQLNTVAQTRQLVKHSLDLYRSKGTERSVDLFFRALFGKPASVYYPGQDIFRLSDGKWIKPTYLEVTPSTFNEEFVGQQIEGVTSGATAFVERFIKRKIKSKYINVLYISAISGNFQTGELLTLSGQTLKNLPTVIGSTTTLDIVVGGELFKVGDIVNIESDNGVQGKGRVTTISTITGIVDYEIIDSGWGYTSEADFIVSEKVLTLDNVVPLANNTSNTPFYLFETLTQPFANIVIRNANATFSPANGDNLYTYSNNVLIGKGTVLTYTANGSTNGEVYVAQVYGNLAPITEVNANQTGTVNVSSIVIPLTGNVSVNTSSSNVVGNGTSFVGNVVVGSSIRIFAYNANGTLLGDTSRTVTAVTNDIHLTVSSNLNFESNSALVQLNRPKIVIGSGTSFTSLAYGQKIAFFTNSSNYILRTVNAISNDTYLTVQEDIDFTNTAATYANTTVNYKIYTESNTISANILTYSDKTQTANVMGIGSNLIFTVEDMDIAFSNNQQVYQLNANNVEIANGNISSVTTIQGANAFISVVNAHGVFQPDTAQVLRVRYANGLTNTATANLKNISMTVGVYNISTAFSIEPNNFVYGSNSSTTASISRISSGTLSNAGFSNTFVYSEEVTLLPVDLPRDYANVKLNAVAYGFKANTAANATTQYLDDILTLRSVTMGGIASLIGINPGKNYDTAPFVTVYDPITSPYDKRDYNFVLSNASSVYSIGEIVSQTNGAKGLVQQANLSFAQIKRIQFNNTFDISLALVGESSGSSANIVSIGTNDLATKIGLNAIIQSNVQSSNGSVLGMDVYDSGFGFLNGENATFTSNDGLRSGTVRINLGKQGISEGYYRNKNGFLSDGKKIFDGEYYQEYSYEIRTSVTPDKYADMLKKVLHVAGTKAFYNIVYADTANTQISIKSSISQT